MTMGSDPANYSSVSSHSNNNNNNNWSNASTKTVEYLFEQANLRGAISDDRRILVTVIMTIIIVVTMFGNVLTIIAIGTDRSLRSIHNIYIASLAAADFVVSGFVMTVFLCYSIVLHGEWFGGRLFCDIWQCIDNAVCTTSLLSICAITYDRHLTLSYPLRSKYVRTRRKALIAVCLLWLLPLIFWIVVLCVQRQLYRESGSEHCFIVWSPIYFSTVIAAITVYIPVAIILLLFLRIMVTVRLHMRKMNRFAGGGATLAEMALSSTMMATIRLARGEKGTIEAHRAASLDERRLLQTLGCIVEDDEAINGDETSTDSGTNQRRRHSATPELLHPRCSYGDLLRYRRQNSIVRANIRYQVRTARTLGLITALLLLCWLPFAVMLPLRSAQPLLLPQRIFDIALWAKYLHSAINPIVYPLCNTKFRNAFRNLFCSKGRKTRKDSTCTRM